MRIIADALVIGGGPAGCASAILLAQAGWHVTLVEQSAYPRQKVCGECISAGSLALFDSLGVGASSMAGPQLSRVGWMGSLASLDAEFPACSAGAYPYGRAMGRDRLDALLLERARSVGVEVLQPAKVRAVHGDPGNFAGEIEIRSRSRSIAGRATKRLETHRARVVIDAHGSWEPPLCGSAIRDGDAAVAPLDAPKRASDLFAFKASFDDSRLSPGLLPVLALDGGYGGMVVADGGRTTLACCIRRDRLRASREAMPGVPAGEAVAAFLHRSCAGVRDALIHARQRGPWLSVGPIRPGIRVGRRGQIFRVGNAAGESHPLIGEGIAMALQSAHILAEHLSLHRPGTLDSPRTRDVNARYAEAWRAAFAPRVRFAAAAAHAAMQPGLASLSHALLRRWPGLLTQAARWAGKTRHYIVATKGRTRHEHA